MNSRVLPGLALMVSVGIFFVYVNPIWSGSIAETKAAIRADDEALAAADSYIAQEKQLTDERNKIDPTSLARLTNFLPDSVDNVGLILDLNALAARNGLSLSNIDVTTSGAPVQSADANVPGAISTATNPVNAVDLTLSAAGTYAALKTFLNGLEKSERLLDLQDLSIQGSDTGVYAYHMKLRIYWLH